MKDLIDQVRQMIKQGYRTSEITAALGISKHTVAKYRTVAETGKSYAQSKLDELNESRTQDLEFPELDPQGIARYERCSGCGGMVQLPCFLCQIREKKNGKHG